MNAVLYAQSVTTGIFLVVTLLMFVKVVLPTARHTLPYLKSKLPDDWYLPLAFTIIIFEGVVWILMVELYHHVMWSLA